MDPSLPQQPQTDRRADSGRVAMPEIAELLHLQRPAAAVAAAAVVLLALLVTLVTPSVLAANIVTGLVVGVLALLAAAATAVLLDGRDPVLRGPRHLRRDGHTVLARMAGPDPAEHGGPVLAAIERRLEGREHLGIVLTGTGADPSELAVTLGRAAAADGHTALVIDLRAPGAPGVADVGEGTVRLGEAARLADDRPYAWIGAGVDREAAGRAAAGVANRPPRDLKLLLVVAPDAATHVPEVLGACDRTVLLVAADTQQRAMVTARLNALERAGGRPEAVVVGGLRVLADDDGALDIGTAPVVEPEPPSMPGGPAAAAAPTAPPTPAPTAAPAVDPALEPAEQEVPAEPAEPELPVASEPEPEPEMAEGLERTGPMSLAPPSTVPEPPQPDEPEPATPPAPEPDPVQVPDPEAIAPDATDDLAAAPQTVDEPHDVETPASSDPGSPPPVFRTASPARPERSPFAPAPAEPAEAARAEAARAATEPTAPARPASEPAAVDHSSSVAAPVGDTSIEGMAEPDPLLTVAALEQLVSERRQRGAG